jgi:hypothetical protein
VVWLTVIYKMKEEGCTTLRGGAMVLSFSAYSIMDFSGASKAASGLLRLKRE